MANNRMEALRALAAGSTITPTASTRSTPATMEEFAEQERKRRAAVTAKNIQAERSVKRTSTAKSATQQAAGKQPVNLVDLLAPTKPLNPLTESHRIITAQDMMRSGSQGKAALESMPGASQNWATDPTMTARRAQADAYVKAAMPTAQEAMNARAFPRSAAQQAAMQNQRGNDAAAGAMEQLRRGQQGQMIQTAQDLMRGAPAALQRAGQQKARADLRGLSDEELQGRIGALSGAVAEYGDRLRTAKTEEEQRKWAMAKDRALGQLEDAQAILEARPNERYYQKLEERMAELEKSGNKLSAVAARNILDSKEHSFGGNGYVSAVMAYLRAEDKGNAKAEFTSQLSKTYPVGAMERGEKNTVLALVGEGRYDDAQAYLEGLQRRINQRINGESREMWAEFGQKHPYVASALNTVSWAGGGAAMLGAAGQMIRNAATGEYAPADPNAPEFQPARMAQGTAQGVAEWARADAEKAFGSKTAGDVASFVAQTALSVGQNATQLPLGPMALAAMSVNAAGMAATEAIDNGASPTQAFLVGTAKGAVEAATEKLSLDRVLDILEDGGKETARNVIADLLVQAGVEASEEMTSEVAGNLVDGAILASKSDYHQMIRELMDQGMSYTEAATRTYTRFCVFNVLSAGAGGALSGGIMGAGANLWNSAGQYTDTLFDEWAAKRAAKKQGQTVFPAGSTEAVQMAQKPLEGQAAPGDVRTPPTAERAKIGRVTPRESAPAGLVSKAEYEQEKAARAAEMERRTEDGRQQQQEFRGADPAAPDQRRAAGAGAGEQAGPVDGGAEGNGAERGAQSVRARERQTAVEARGVGRISARDAGVERGGADAWARVIPEDLVEQDQELRDIREANAARGLRTSFFVGSMLLDDGKTRIEGWIDPRTREVWVQADASSDQSTATMINDHERGHELLQDRALMAEVAGRLLGDGSEEALKRYDAMVKAYVRAYTGVYDMETIEGRDMALEELLADAYAGRDRFEGKAGTYYQETVRPVLERGQQDTGRQAGAELERNAGPPQRFAIETLPDGKKYVRADRQVIFGNDPDSWAEQIERYINKKILKGETVSLLTDDGDILVLNRETEGKASFRNNFKLPDGSYHTLTDDEYLTKLNAESHIDELAQISTRGRRNYPDDGTHGSLADIGWNYRTAFFQDEDGKYYKVKISVAIGDQGKVVYNVGQVEERSFPNSDGSSAKGGAQKGETPSGAKISQSGKVVNTQNQGKEPINLVDLLEGGKRFSVAEETGPQSAEDARAAEQAEKDKRTDEIFGFRRVEAMPEEQAEQAGAETETRRDQAKPDAEPKPSIAKKDLRRQMLDMFSIPAGKRAELGDMVDSFADRIARRGEITEEDRQEFFDRLYEAGVMEVDRGNEYQADALRQLRGTRVYVDPKSRAEFSDDWNAMRRRAFANGIYFTSDVNDSHVDQLNMSLSQAFPGLFNEADTDDYTILNRMMQLIEEGRTEKLSLSDYAQRMAGVEFQSEEKLLDELERQTDWALRTFAEKAELEMTLKERSTAQAAKDRERRLELRQRQREAKSLREMRQRTLKQLQWLSRNQTKAPAELQDAFREVLSDIDIYAIGAARLATKSRKYSNMSWEQVAELYKELTTKGSESYDPNIAMIGKNAELQRIISRVDKTKIADLDVVALTDLYKAVTGLRHAVENVRSLVGAEERRRFGEVFRDSVAEIRAAPGGWTGGPVQKMDQWQMTPMNRLEQMAGWDPNSTFYSMAKQLEQGERDVRDYVVRGNAMLEPFLKEHEDFVRHSDGQGKTVVVRTAAEAREAVEKGLSPWYEVEVPELLEFQMGDKPIFGETKKVYMTPAQKVQLYLESKCQDNLRHMLGGRKFANMDIYSRGDRVEGMAQGTIIRLAPESVLRLVEDMTPQEMAMAEALERYYNEFAKDRINKTSNALYGYDKAMSAYYAPIFTEDAYNRKTTGIYDLTAEGAGHMKGRIPYAETPSRNISALDAFERHMDQTSYWTGITIPTHNMDTLMNWQKGSDSMRSVIQGKWGAAGTKFIENLTQELQGKQFKEKSMADQFADTVLSRYITSVFGANPSIVAKQVMSLPLAGTYLGWKNAPNVVEARRTSDKLINTYTSELAYRLMGYATPETAALKNNPSKLQSNKAYQFAFGGGAITAADGFTVKTIWKWAENAVRRDSPDLQAGTQEEIDAGSSPFYQEVARRFEEAVSRSQPMYDVMHRSGAMRSEGAATRTLTIFKTVPQQQYNMLRQTAEEAKAAKRALDKGTISEDAYRQVKVRSGRALTGVILAGLGVEAVNLLAALIKNGGKKYKDEETGEMTFLSAAPEFFKGFLKDNVGMVIGGDMVADFLGSLITGDKWYGIETPGITQIGDLLEKMKGAFETAGGVVQDALGVMHDGGDVTEYFRRNGHTYLGAVDEVAETLASYAGGVPAHNIKTYVLGAVSVVCPQARVAYEDALATADKKGLKGLSGKGLRVRVGDILDNRLGEKDQAVAEELSALYEAGYPGAVFGDTPEHPNVNGEERQLSATQRQFYDRVFRESVAGELSALVGSDVYREQDQATRAKILGRLYDYGDKRAKEALFDDYYPDAWVGEAARSDDGAGDWIAWNVLSQKPAAQKEPGEKEYKDSLFDKFLANGMDKGTSLEAVKAVQGLEPLEGHTGVADKQKYLAVAEMGLGRKDTDAAMKALMDERAFEKYRAAIDAQVEAETYAQFLIDIDRLTSDKDEDGKDIKGQTRKDKVVEVIDGYRIGGKQKDALYLSQYKESGLKGTPWN